MSKRVFLVDGAKIPTDKIDEVILGCVMPSEREANIGRVVSLRLGIPESVPAWTVQRNCASGMQSIDSAMNRIQLGHSEVVLAGGAEAMSRAPVLFGEKYVDWLSSMFGAKTAGKKLGVLSKFRFPFLTPVFALEHGLTDPVVKLNMGQTAEKIAKRFEVSREDMDEFAVQSHLKAYQAKEEGVFEDEIVPIFDNKGKSYTHDDGVRADSNVAKLSTLKPVFDKPFGKVTAANSSQISDGAAWVLLASEEAVKEYGLEPLAELKSLHWAGLDPTEMGLGPAYATAKLLIDQNLTLEDIDFWEYNEAFAAQVIACVEALKSDEYCKEYIGLDSSLGEIPKDKLNIHGGAVACGHPVGMSGTRIVLHMAHILKQKNAKRGIASLCIGGGQGGATLVEAVN